jgi:phosphate transport system regulatory protein PhoU
MIRLAYEKELEKLKLDAIRMSAMCERMINESVEALVKRDRSAAKAVIESDDEVDNMERQIEKECLRLFLRQQPVAKDFREVSAILKMITDLERIGDQAADISQIMLSLDEKEEYVKKLVHIPMMAERAIAMVHEAMLSFIEEDIEKAQKVIDSDDEVDGLFETIKAEFVEILRRDGSVADQALLLMMIAKYLERIADHATNLAEWVIYFSTGTKP